MPENFPVGTAACTRSLTDGVAAIDPEAVRAAARWQPADQAADLLYRQFPVIAKPQLTIWPGWFPRLPWLAWRIEVSIEPEGK